MTSILISSDDLTLGRATAKSVAASLGAEFVGRDILPDIAKERGVTEGELRKLLRFTGKLGAAERRLLIGLGLSVSSRIQKDNVVCTGLGAHLYVRNVSHILNVRVLSDIDSMTHQTAARKNISPSKVRLQLEKKMRKRRAWTLAAFGVDETQPANYDMLFTLGNFDVERVVKTVAETAQDRKFTAMTYSRKCLADQVSAGKVRLALVKQHPDVGVRVKDGTAFLTIPKGWRWRKKAESAKRIASEVDDVSYVRVFLAGEERSTDSERVADAAQRV